MVEQEVGRRDINSSDIQMNRWHQDNLLSDIARLENDDPNDGATFAIRYSLITELAEIEGKSKLDVIKKEKEKILKRDWTPEASEQMVFLNTEQQLQENPQANPNVTNFLACSGESKRISNIARGLLKEFKTTDSTKTLIYAEKMLAISDSLNFRGKLFATKALEQASQKSSSITRK